MNEGIPAGTTTKSSKPKGLLFSAVIILVVIAVVIFYRNHNPRITASASMEPTLSDGGTYMTNPAAYLTGVPKNGDVVTYERKNALLVTRIIGIPGDEVEIRDGHVFLNGKSIEVGENKERIGETEWSVTAMDSNTSHTQKLLDGEYYVLGDNRDNSLGSHVMGPLTKDAIKARVITH